MYKRKDRKYAGVKKRADTQGEISHSITDVTKEVKRRRREDQWKNKEVTKDTRMCMWKRNFKRESNIQ